MCVKLENREVPLSGSFLELQWRCSTSVRLSSFHRLLWELYSEFGQSWKEIGNIFQVDNSPVKSLASPFNLRGKNWAQPWALRTVWLPCSGRGVTRGAVQFQWWTDSGPGTFQNSWNFRLNWLQPFISRLSSWILPWRMSMIFFACVVRVRDGLPLSASTDFHLNQDFLECRKRLKALSSILARYPSRGTAKGRNLSIQWVPALPCWASFAFNFWNNALGDEYSIEIIPWVWSAMHNSSLKSHSACLGSEFRWFWSLIPQLLLSIVSMCLFRYLYLSIFIYILYIK